MKKLIIYLFVSTGILSIFGSCKKEVYPDELQFLVVDSFSRKPISNATINLYKVWQHPTKMGNNAQDGDWFPEYGRKHMSENQTGHTDENGLAKFDQAHKKYLYVIPGVAAEGYQMPILDTLKKFNKKAANKPYTFALIPMIKTSFIIKSFSPGFETDSVVFSSCDQKIVAYGKNINKRLDVYTSTYDYNYSIVWYNATIYRKGKTNVICSSVKSYLNRLNEHEVNVDL